jgi:probable phosphoglycerate mutase
MTARLIIVRHGNTFETGDIVTRVGGRTDLPLSPSGEAQAQKLAEAFTAQPFASARSGPLKRTRRTAALILAAQQSPPPELLTELFLREIDYGPDENKPEEEVKARLGHALEAWEKHSIPPPEWRVDPAALTGNWQELFADLREEEGTHLVVTSNGIARFALHAAYVERPDMKLATGAYGVIELDGEAVAVREWNVRP